MPRKQVIRPCQCGAADCNETTKSTFAPGHDSKMLSAIKEACGGDSLAVRAVVEEALGHKI